MIVLTFSAMIELLSSFEPSLLDEAVPRHCKTKKADVAKHPTVFGHVGLLGNEPPGTAGLPFS